VKTDVVVIGAGASGLVCASLLAKAGKRVALLERNRFLGGRAREFVHRGHRIGLGSHLVEDPGDSLTAVCDQLGLELVHSERSDSMPFWDKDRWRPIQEFYADTDKGGVKRCIEALLETSYDELETWDHASLREWMAQYTDDSGVYLVWEAISVLEQITSSWWEHSASENLYTRKMHYTAKRTAGYSFWPMGGWDKVWNELAGALEAAGGTLRLGASVSRVDVRDGRVHGVELAGGEQVEADEVVVSVPVWGLLRLFDDGALPWDLEQRIRFFAQNRNRCCWIGYWIASREPVIGLSEREMSSFFATPRAGLPGFSLCFTGYDREVSPPGEYLTCVGAAFDATQHYGDRDWLDRKFHELWLDVEQMMPAAKTTIWRKPHVVTTYGVVCKPGMVGSARPDVRVRGVDGLWLCGDTTRARGIGIDKAARSGITAAEAVLGSRLPAFAGTVHY
jgi:phytoene dehydrogenase-like protein